MPNKPDAAFGFKPKHPNGIPDAGLERLADEIKHLHAEVFAGMLSPLYVDKKVIEALTQTHTAGRAERDGELEQGIGNLRQWLNEDRITDLKKMVTNEEIKIMMGITH